MTATAALESILARLRALQPGICPFVHTDDRGEELEMTVEYAAVDRIADDLEHAIRELQREDTHRD